MYPKELTPSQKMCHVAKRFQRMAFLSSCGSSAGPLMKKECPPDDYLKNGLYSILACGTRGVSLLSGTGKETSATWRLRRGNHKSERNDMKPLRLALLGFGTVGQWLAQALQAQHARLQQEYGLVVTIISVATARSGLIYRGDGKISPPYSILPRHDSPSAPIPRSPTGRTSWRDCKQLVEMPWSRQQEPRCATQNQG
jgi:hypothetical protein